MHRAAPGKRPFAKDLTPSLVACEVGSFHMTKSAWHPQCGAELGSAACV